MKRPVVVLVCAAVAMGAAGGARAGDKRPKPEVSLGLLKTAPAIEKLLGGDGVKGIQRRVAPPKAFEAGPAGADGAAAARTAFLEKLDKIWITKGWDSGDFGAAEGEEGKARFAVPMTFNGTDWVVDASQWFAVGAALNAANGPKPGRVKLAARDDKTEGYGMSALSFTHVTQDPAKCLNRMDVWYCWNGELHGSGGKLTKVPEAAIDGVKSIPASSAWSDTVAPKSGQVFVQRCLHPGRTDFYVVLRVSSLTPAECVIDWKLLATGYGAPASIQSEQPLASKDAADVVAGLCVRAGSPPAGK